MKFAREHVIRHYKMHDILILIIDQFDCLKISW